MPYRRFNRSVRFIDMLTALLWVAAIGMLVAATFIVPEVVPTARSTRGLMIVWSLGLFSAAIGATIVSCSLWVVRQFEEAFQISQNVQAINDELAHLRQVRERRQG